MSTETATLPEDRKISLPGRLLSMGAGLVLRVFGLLLHLWQRFRRFWLKVFVFWAGAAAYLWIALAYRNAYSIGDTDDALRLVQWRLFRDGAGWHDLLIARMGAPEGLVSHWSRLVDAGLLALYWPLSLFLPPEQAETVMRLAWPLLMLFVAFSAVALIARSLGGRRAVAPALVLALLALPTQFTPGRIDHHNVQIALTLLTWAFFSMGMRRSVLLFPAGLLISVTLAIGLEAIPFILPILAAGAIAWAKRALPGEGRAAGLLGGGVAAGALFMLPATLPPGNLMGTACDVFAANWAFPLLAWGVLLAVLSFLPQRLTSIGKVRMGLAVVPFVTAGGLFAAMEPQCLKGPFAHLPAAVKKGWLAHVPELQPILKVFAETGFSSAWTVHALWPALALLIWLGTVVIFRRRSPRMTTLALAGTVALSLMLGALHLRLLVYAQWLTIPLLAQALVMLMPRRGLVHAAMRLAAGMALAPLSILALGIMAAGKTEAAAAGTETGSETGLASECTSAHALAPLARLPKGLLAGDLALQPYVLVYTPHAVLAGPYHRIAEKIEDNIRLLTEEPQKARLRALTLGLDYIAFCPDGRVYGPDGRKPGPESLWQHLARNKPPPWLEPVNLESQTALRVYRVRANRPLPAVIDVPEVLIKGIEKPSPALRESLP